MEGEGRGKEVEVGFLEGFRAVLESERGGYGEVLKRSRQICVLSEESTLEIQTAPIANFNIVTTATHPDQVLVYSHSIIPHTNSLV